MVDMFGQKIERGSWVVYRLSSSAYSSNGLSLGRVMAMRSDERCKVCSVGTDDQGKYYLRDQCYLRSSKSVLVIHEHGVPQLIKDLINSAIENRQKLDTLKLVAKEEINE